MTTSNYEDVNFTQLALNDAEPSVLYARPGIIKNHELLLNQAAKSSCGKSGHLKADLALNYDYVFLSKDVWLHLYSWYSADYVIHRQLKRQERHLG